MQVRELAIAGGFEFTPDVHTDLRGQFAAPYQEAAFVAAVGRPFSPHSSTTAGPRGT